MADSKQAAHSADDDRRQYVNFAFYKVDPAWRRLPAEDRRRGKCQFIDAVKTFEPEMLVIPYSLVGIRGDCDFMLWRIGYELPKLQEMTSNLTEVSQRVRSQAENMDSALNEVVDRARLQTIRVDDLVTRTIDKVEETTDLVQQSVISPVRQLNGIVHALSAGIGAFVTRRRKAATDAAQARSDEEMFI